MTKKKPPKSKPCAICGKPVEPPGWPLLPDDPVICEADLRANQTLPSAMVTTTTTKGEER